MSEKRRYIAYLVRWQENEEGTSWRGAVEGVYTGEKVYFADKNKLMLFIWQALNDDAIFDSAESDDTTVDTS